MFEEDVRAEQQKQKPMCFQKGILMKNELICPKMAQELEVAGTGESRDEE